MTEREFVHYWKNTDFSVCNEMDVREDFISVLLHILGYSKNTVNDILREKTLNLTEPFQRVGRKQVKIDYVPTIRLKSFWILEAKPGNIKEMDVGDLLQAYLYATHPEIQAQYVVLCNGWSLMIYDVQQIENWDTPVYKITQNDCQDKFAELKQILSAKTMLESRRKRLLQQIKNTFEVELDIEQWKFFVSEFNRMTHPLELKIKENVKELQRKDFEAREKNVKQVLENADESSLLSWMALSGPRTAALYTEYYNRIARADARGRVELIRKLMQRYWGRCHAEFKCDCLAILLLVVGNQLEIEASPHVADSKTLLKQVIKDNLTYHKDAPMQNALDYLDKICCKFAYLVMKNSLMGTVSEKIEDRKLTMAVEELIIERPSVAREMVRLINICVDYLWMYLSSERTTQDIWLNIRVLDYYIQKITGLVVPKYPDGDSDLLYYDSYGDKCDYLFRVSCMLLRNRIDIIKRLDLDDEVKKIVFAPEETMMEYMPQMPVIEEELGEEEIKRVVYKIVIALIKTGECWRDIDSY